MPSMSRILSISDKVILFPLWLITLLHLPVLYPLADGLSVLLCYIIRYRRKVVLQNLKNSFPEKSHREIKRIMWRFYRYLCDYFVESLYTINMSLEECNKRYSYTNPELLEKYFREGKSVVLTTSHYGCWEWSANFTSWFSPTIFAIYKPLSNKLFDRLFIYIRSKYGLEPIPMKKTLRTIADCLKKNETFALLFLADQRPARQDLSYWTFFMNQETPVITGMDRLARKYNLPVVFMNVSRPRRGYYEITYETIEPEPAKTKPNELAEKYIRCVEKLVRNQPEFYLWSHKRWKYRADKYKPGVN
jgi:Kdo2-lipid IVA lauroyltransferase/acyltransferase